MKYGDLARLRNEALDRGDTKYTTGQPCVRGHEAERYASTGDCVECMKVRIANQRKSGARSRIDNAYYARRKAALQGASP